MGRSVVVEGIIGVRHMEITPLADELEKKKSISCHGLMYDKSGLLTSASMISIKKGLE